MSNSTLQDATRALAFLMGEQAKAQERVRNIQDDIDAVRQQVQTEMVAGEYKTLESNGLQVQIRTKKYPQVVNSGVLEEHLHSLGIREQYIVTRFDTVKARNDGAKNGWPGVEVEERQELVVKVVS